LGFHVLLVLLFEWLTLFPVVVPLPHISHFQAMNKASFRFDFPFAEGNYTNRIDFFQGKTEFSLKFTNT